MESKDFSRIQELFYDNINSKLQNNLKGFIAYALNQYDEKYLSFESTETMDFCFLGESGSNAKLNLIVSKSDQKPDLSSITISGVSCDPIVLLSRLNGKLEAEYDNTLVKNIDERLLSHVSKNSKSRNLQAGMLNMSFTYDQDNEPRVISGVLDSNPSLIPLIKNVRKEFRLEDLNLDAYTSNLLRKASHIAVTNHFYRDNNPNNELFLETCHVYNNSDGVSSNDTSSDSVSDIMNKVNDVLAAASDSVSDCTPSFGRNYLWKYNLRANNGFLPIELLPSIDKIFSLVNKDFTNKSFYKVQANNLTNRLYSGGSNGA